MQDCELVIPLNKNTAVFCSRAKVKDKIQLIENMLDKVNVMIIAGGMAFYIQYEGKKLSFIHVSIIDIINSYFFKSLRRMF